MKINFRNKSVESDRRVALKPRNSPAPVVPETPSNPTVGVDKDGVMTFCLSAYVENIISCVGATDSTRCITFDEDGLYDVYIGDQLVVTNGSPTDILEREFINLRVDRCIPPDFLLLMPTTGDFPINLGSIAFFVKFKEVPEQPKLPDMFVMEDASTNDVYRNTESSLANAIMYGFNNHPYFSGMHVNVKILDYDPSSDIPYHVDYLNKYANYYVTGEPVTISTGSSMTRSLVPRGISLSFENMPSNIEYIKMFTSTTDPIVDYVVEGSLDTPIYSPFATMLHRTIAHYPDGEKIYNDALPVPALSLFVPGQSPCMEFPYPVATGVDYDLDLSSEPNLYMATTNGTDENPIKLVRIPLPPRSGKIKCTISYPRKGQLLTGMSLQPVTDKIDHAPAFVRSGTGDVIYHDPCLITFNDYGGSSGIIDYFTEIDPVDHPDGGVLYLVFREADDAVKVRLDDV